jgi:hypothetical protein
MNQPLDQDYKFLIGEYAPLGLALLTFQKLVKLGVRGISFTP